MIGRTLVGRAVFKDLQDRDRLREAQTWLRSLGLNPTDYAREMTVTTGENGHWLHLVEYLRDQGRMYIDPNTGKPAQLPLAVQVEPGSWPAWLTGLGTGRAVAYAPTIGG